MPQPFGEGRNRSTSTTTPPVPLSLLRLLLYFAAFTVTTQLRWSGVFLDGGSPIALLLLQGVGAIVGAVVLVKCAPSLNGTLLRVGAGVLCCALLYWGDLAALSPTLPGLGRRGLRALPGEAPPTLTSKLCGDEAAVASFAARFTASTAGGAHPPGGGPLPLAPFIHGDGFRAVADFVCDGRGCPDGPTLQAWGKERPGQAAVIFATDAAGARVGELTLHKTPFVLVTASDGTGMPPSLAQATPSLLSSPDLVAWFAQDPHIAHVKLHALPLGASRSPVAAGADSTRLLAARCAPSPAIAAGNVSVLLAWSDEVAHALRAPVEAAVKGWPEDELTMLPVKKRGYLQALGDHAMVLCPRGGGLDTVCTWEALYSGRVPVVESSLLNSLYARLPVVVLPPTGWQGLTRNGLFAAYAALSSNVGAIERRTLELGYHLCRIEVAAGRRFASECGGGGLLEATEPRNATVHKLVVRATPPPETSPPYFVSLDELAVRDPSSRPLARGCYWWTDKCTLQNVYDEIFVIGMPSRMLQLTRIRSQLAALGVKYTLIKAQDRQAPGIREQEQLYMREKARNDKGGGVVALLVTQLAVFDYIARSPGSRFLLLEDDVIFQRDFPAVFDRGYRAVPSSWRYLFLGADVKQHQFDAWDPKAQASAGYAEIRTREGGGVWGSWALSLTKRGAAELADLMRTTRSAIDQDPYNRLFNGVLMKGPTHSYLLWPQAAMMPHTESDLGNNRNEDARAKINKMNGWEIPRDFDVERGYVG